MKLKALAQIGTASPVIEKQGLLPLVFVKREYSG
jgi:hypothetical protein